MIHQELLVELHRFLFWFKPKHKKSELSLAEIMVLTVLYKEQCSTKQDVLPSYLSNELGLSRSALSPILNGLEKNGCIERILDENDRRQIIIRLKKNPDEMMFERKEKIIEMMNVLSIDEIAQFYTLLQKINKSLDNSNNEYQKAKL